MVSTQADQDLTSSLNYASSTDMNTCPCQMTLRDDFLERIDQLEKRMAILMTTKMDETMQVQGLAMFDDLVDLCVYLCANP